MATYSDKSFNAAHYDNARPSYPQSFYEELMAYHSGKTDLAVDIGCGTGLVTFELAKYFTDVIGTDPSITMIKQCKTRPSANIDFKVGSAEALPDIAANSIDMITGAECIHWVDHAKFYKESWRILKPGGTLAYWFYKDPIIIGFPKANALYDKYCYGDDYMGPFWQQPGRNFLRTFMKEVEVPQLLFDNVTTQEYLVEDFPQKTPLSIKMTVTVDWWESYIKSWSAYHSWMKENGDKNDIAEDFVQELKQLENWSNDTEIELIWETMYTFAKKK